jgi:hypothetical protein
MWKKLGLPTLVLGTALSVLSPGAALARDHDERYQRREWREHRYRPRIRAHFYYGPAYSNGYYDRWGYWHPYRGGYYDRWGYFHSYRY